MASSNFTFDDVLADVREQLNDNAQRRITDTRVFQRHLYRAYAQLRNDRPDIFVGHTTFGAENFKPASTDPLPFDDAGYHTFVEAVLASVEEKSAETASGVQQAADSRAERARRS